jgi:hypothetical protein
MPRIHRWAPRQLPVRSAERHLRAHGMAGLHGCVHERPERQLLELVWEHRGRGRVGPHESVHVPLQPAAEPAAASEPAEPDQEHLRVRGRAVRHGCVRVQPEQERRANEGAPHGCD